VGDLMQREVGSEGWGGKGFPGKKRGREWHTIGEVGAPGPTVRYGREGESNANQSPAVRLVVFFICWSL